MTNLMAMDFDVSSASMMADAVSDHVDGQIGCSVYDALIGMDAAKLAGFCQWLKDFTASGGNPWDVFQPSDFWTAADAAAVSNVGYPADNPMQAPACMYS